MQHINPEFCGPRQIFQIQVTNREQAFTCPAGANLLKAMERKSRDCIQIGCRGGGCGLCKIRVLSGQFESKRMSKAHISDDDLTEGVVLACRIFPTSDLVIESDQYQPPGSSA